MIHYAADLLGAGRKRLGRPMCGKASPFRQLSIRGTEAKPQLKTRHSLWRSIAKEIEKVKVVMPIMDGRVVFGT